jgi:hypothetical protein
MQISSVSPLSASSSLVGAGTNQQNRPQSAGQILPDPAKASAPKRPFSLPRHSLTASAAPQTSAAPTRMSSAEATAAYESAMNAQGYYGSQATFGMRPLIA